MIPRDGIRHCISVDVTTVQTCNIWYPGMALDTASLSTSPPCRPVTHVHISFALHSNSSIQAFKMCCRKVGQMCSFLLYYSGNIVGQAGILWIYNAKVVYCEDVICYSFWKIWEKLILDVLTKHFYLIPCNWPGHRLLNLHLNGTDVLVGNYVNMISW